MSERAATWTPEDVRRLGVTTDLPTAYRIVFAGGRNSAWAAYHRGDLPFRTLRVGRKVRVPVADLLRLLGLEATTAV